jgi:DNA repair protein RecO (recombination protein O)
MAIYRDSGVVLRTIRLGEADRIVTLFTEGRGKVRAVAKGIRKTKSRFGGRLEPITHVALQLYEGRELDTVTQAETLDHFRVIREDLERFGRATALLEAVDQVAQIGEPNPALYRMLVGALRALAANSSPLLVAGFYWKLLSLEGFHPILDACASCASEGPLVSFDLLEGGALCRDCRRGLAVTEPALVLVRRLLGGDLGSALHEPASQATAEAEAMATRALEHHIERRLRTAASALMGDLPLPRPPSAAREVPHRGGSTSDS